MRKLVCFGDVGWRKLRGWAGRKELCGDESERRLVIPEAVLVDLEEREEGGEALGTSIDIELPKDLLSWWEVERWEEIYEEHLLWGDLSHEGKRTLRKLLG